MYSETDAHLIGVYELPDLSTTENAARVLLLDGLGGLEVIYGLSVYFIDMI